MTAQICTLYLVRHGQTQWNVDKIIQGHINIPLTEEGERQAYEQKENLKNIKFSKVYSSDLIRAHRTAEILNSDRELSHDKTAALRERNFGTYEGKSRENDKIQLFDLINSDSNHPHLKESGVESNDSMINRSLTFLRKKSLKHVGKNVLVVSHGGLIREILIHLKYAKADDFPPRSIKNLAYIKLECDGITFTVKETFGIVLNDK